MFSYARVFFYVAISYSINTNVVAQASFDEIIGYTEDQQLEYLKNASQQSFVSSKSNPEPFVKMLVDIAAEKNSASGIAIYYLQLYLLQISDNSSGYRQPGYAEILNSTYINNKLSEIILLPDANKKLLAGAITAHSLIYPPNNTLLEFYKDVIIEANSRKGKVIANILEAQVKYQLHNEYKIPNYVYKKLPELIDHHSDSVQIQAITMLTDKNGLDYLPMLFTLLESNKHGSGVCQTIIYKILSLDTSDKTIQQLQQSKEKVNNSRVRKSITISLLPKNLARQREINGQ